MPGSQMSSLSTTRWRQRKMSQVEHHLQICLQKCSATYIGETSRNLYTRGLEHQDKFEKRKPDSFMHNHQEERHPGDQPDYNVSVVQRPTVSAGSRGSPHNEVQRRNIEQQIRVQTATDSQGEARGQHRSIVQPAEKPLFNFLKL